MQITNSSPPRNFLYRHKKSQAAVEFALAFPIFMMVVFGIIDFSLLFTAWLSIQNMARQAVRYAATGQYDSVKYCDLADASPIGDHDGTPCDGSKKDAEIDWARLQSTHDVAQNFSYFIFKDNSVSLPDKGYLRVSVCSTRDTSTSVPPDGPDFVYNYPRMGGLTPDDYGYCYLYGGSRSDVVEDVGGPGDRVIVGVDFNHPYLTPFINSVWPLFHLASNREAIVEKFRLSKVRDVPPPIPQPTLTPLPATITLTPTITNTPEPPTLTPTSTSTATNTATPGPCDNDGHFLREYWDGISGNNVTDLTDSAAYPYNPTGVDLLYTGGGAGLETIHGSSGMDNHGERLRGYICVDQTTEVRFFLASDDGGQLLIDGNVVASESGWSGYRAWKFSFPQRSAKITLPGRTMVRFEVLSKNGSGGYNASVGWVSGADIDTTNSNKVQVVPLAYLSRANPDATLTPTASPTPPCPGLVGTGLRGDYYDWTDFSQPNPGWAYGSLPLLASRIDPTVNFPSAGTWQLPAPPTKFAVRWRGKVLAPIDGQYKFYSESDDGQVLWVNGVRLVNDWNGHGMTEYNGVVDLVACQQYDIVLEYYQGSGGYGEILRWKTPGGVKGVIPQAFLFPADPYNTSTPGPTKTPTLTRTPTLTATITRTPTITITPTITWTPNCNLAGAITTTNSTSSIQNGMAFGCPTGCFDSPYLKGASANNKYLPAGTYYWTVEEVNPPGQIVNSGSFFLPPNTLLDPVAGVSVPIGNFTNPPPPSYYPGIFKVTIWQDGAKNCGTKTDNFTILAAAPSPTPTVTRTQTVPPPTPTATVPSPTPRPTHTATPTRPTPTQTSTPAPSRTPTRTPFGCTDC